MSTAWKSSLCMRARGAWPVMHRMGMRSAMAEYRPVTMSVPAGPEVPMHTPMLPATGAGVALGHVRGAFDVARQHVGDGAAFAQRRVQRVDGRAGHAEGLRYAFLLHHQNRGHDGLHLCHGSLLVEWPRCSGRGPRLGIPAGRYLLFRAGMAGPRSGGRFIQKVDSAMPATMCQMPHQAVTMAMPPRPPKKLNTSTRPSPEFWMPVSKATARQSRSASRWRAPGRSRRPAPARCARTRR